MDQFMRNINGLDFIFSPRYQEEPNEIYYRVYVENYSFNMHIDENGMWKIDRDVPVWLKELEEKLGFQIEGKNA